MNTLDHPYRNLVGGQWLRGNLHTHTTNSDGEYSPQEVIKKYAKLGYDFLMISDHDHCTSTEDYAKLNANGMILIPGNEISANGPHLLHVNPDRLVDPSPRRQESIRAATAGRGFVIVPHLNSLGVFNHLPHHTCIEQITLDQLREWIGYLGVEIYNGTAQTETGLAYATGKWDILLSEDRRVWGFANDDTHLLNTLVLGWNVAYVKERSAQTVVDALEAGRFYASTGVIINDIQVDGMRIRIETENAERIAVVGRWGARLAMVDERVIEIEVPSDAWYVRFECWGRAEQFAWTQPFFVAQG